MKQLPIKQIKLNKKPRFGWKPKALGILLVLLLIGGLVNGALKAVNSWFEHYKLQFNKPVVVTFKAPIEIKEREVATKEIIRIIETIPAPEDLETDNEKYIYEKWGLEHYRVALSIAMAESHMNCNAVGINSGSADLGLFQINTLWLKNYSLEKLATCTGNIDAAYEIWDNGDRILGNNKGSWNPWVTAKNGAYLNYLQ